HRRLPLPEERERCPQDQPKVETERPAADIGDVHLERLPEARASSCCNLPEPSHALRDQEAVEVVRLEELRLVRNAGTWPDQRHLAAQDVDQLRQLVEAR